MQIPVKTYRGNLALSELFTSLVGWLTSSCTITADPAVLQTGSQSLKLTVTAANPYFYQLLRWPALNLTATKIRIRYYVPQATAAVWNGNITLSLYSTLAGTYATKGLAAYVPPGSPGWHTFDISYIPSQWAITGAFDPTQVTGAMFAMSGLPNTATLNIDSLEIIAAGPTATPTIIFTHDDVSPHLISTIAPYLEGLGYRGTFCVTPSNVDSPGAITLAQLQELDARGHLIAGHGWTHTSWAGLTAAQKELDAQLTADWLYTRGFRRGNHIWACPYDFVGTQADMDMLFKYYSCILTTSEQPRFGVQPNYAGAYSVPQAAGWTRQSLSRTLIDQTFFTNAAVDAVITQKSVGLVLVHNTNGAGGYMTPAQWRAAVDYVANREAATALRVMNLDDYLTNG